MTPTSEGDTCHREPHNPNGPGIMVTGAALSDESHQIFFIWSASCWAKYATNRK